MSNKSRFELFQQSVGRFGRQMQRRFFADFPDLHVETYDLISGSIAKHEYQLTFYKKALLYEDSVTQEEFYEEIEGLTAGFIIKEITDFYKPYELKNEGGKVVSYCRMKRNGTDTFCITETQEKIRCILEVRYHNRFEKPFPCQERRMIVHVQRTDAEKIQYLEEKLAHRNEAYDELSVSYDNLAKLQDETRKKYDKTKQKNEQLLKTTIRKIQMIRELYANQPTKSNCPVCYDEIAPDKLAVNDCCHLLCSDCNNRCFEMQKGCPECRGPITLSLVTMGLV